MTGKLFDFYSGFEGEKEIRLYGINTLSIWDGYFGPIMDVLLDQENVYLDSAFGIVAEWVTLTGWCDIFSEKRKVLNLDDEIFAFSQFDFGKLKNVEFDYMDDEWKQKINNVQLAILELFIDARNKNCEVYIEEC